MGPSVELDPCSDSGLVVVVAVVVVELDYEELEFKTALAFAWVADTAYREIA